jgi:hypothetical protein
MKPVHALLPIVVMLSCTVAEASVIYSLEDDFSNASNPNGAWSFTQGTTSLAHYLPSTPNTIDVALGNGYWGTGNDLNSNTPEVGQTTTNGSATGLYSNADFLSADVIIHSTNTGHGAPVFVNWTAPTAGIINVSGQTWYAHSPVTRSNDFLVSLGATTLTTGTLSNSSNAGRSNAQAFSFSSLVVSAGTVFSVSYTPTAGQVFGSIDGLSETVVFTASPVPEVPEWALISAGLALLAPLSRRRKSLDLA